MPGLAQLVAQLVAQPVDSALALQLDLDLEARLALALQLLAVTSMKVATLASRVLPVR